MARDVDYALLLQVLYSKGYSLASLSRLTGAAVSTLSNVKQELKNVPEAWHDGWEGLSMHEYYRCLLYTSPSPRDRTRSRMPSSA